MRRNGLDSPSGTSPLFVLAGTFLLLLGCKQFKESYQKSFKESFQTSFVTSCTNAATAKGAALATVKPYCECTAKYLVNHRDSSELTKLSANTDSPESKQMLKEATRACVSTLPSASAP